jgi:hypothetical protein
VSLARFLRHERDIVRRVAHDMEYDPRAQWVFHRKMSWIWLFSFIPLAVFTGFDVWGSLGYFPVSVCRVLNASMLAFTAFVSIYANFATDFDAVSASFAAMKAQEIQKETDAESAD